MYKILVMARTNNVVKAKPETIMEMIRAEENLERDLWNVITVIKRVI